jgi:membrane fusion protein, multidrug efflux system
MRKIFSSAPFAAISALVLFASCGEEAPADAKKGQSAPVVEGYVVKPQHLDDLVQVSGTLLPQEETVLMPEISGRITMLNIKEGTFVQKGTLLVKMFDADLQAQASKISAQLATARQTAKRLKDLYAVNGISQQEYDLAQTEVTTLEAEAALIAAQISKTEIRAPFSGVLGLRKVSEGAYVTAGTPIAVLREESNLKLDFNVPENYAASIQRSQNVFFTVANDTTIYSATVIATEQQVNQSSLNLQVRAQVNQHSKKLIPGSSANVRMQLGTSDSALVIPSTAIIPDIRYKKVMVMREGKVSYVQVVTGVRSATEVEVISGLKAGDTVVTSGIQFLRPGSGAKFSSIR